MKRPKNRLQRVVVVGATPAGISAANKLGELDIPVTLVDSDADLDRKLSRDEWTLKCGVRFNFAQRPGLIRILRNPGIQCALPARVEAIKHSHQGFSVTLAKGRTFVDPDLCVLCGKCVEVCPVSVGDGEKAVKLDGRLALPGGAVIDKRRSPLCRENCPLGVNAQGYIALAKAGKYAEALELIREKNVLPGICGRVCTHPCEDHCRRGQLDDTVSVRAIKRFLADYGAKHPDRAKPFQPAARRHETFAVIGSGPAGLAAAAELARNGCKVAVFEKEEKLGGLLRYGIGAHRLPRDVLDAEIDWIGRGGVEFLPSRPVEVSGALKEFAEDFDGVLVTTGAWKDRRLGVPGDDLEGVVGCLSFLRRLHGGGIRELKETVAVIGDGNAAFDLARTLVRMGAEVTLLSWFSMDEIPADPHEIKAALEEGVRVMDKVRVVRFEGSRGRMERLVLQGTKPGPEDEKGIAWPVTDKSTPQKAMAFHRAFVAIGQIGPLAPDNGIGIDSFGYIAVDDRYRTNLEKVYASGDGVSGPSTVVHAMARGRAAARRMLEDVCGLRPSDGRASRPSNLEFPDIPANVPVQNRVPVPETQVAGRKGNFAEVALGLSEAQVVQEAERCLQCGVCSECMQCVEACGAVKAVRHDQLDEEIFEQAGAVIVADPDMAPQAKGEDVIRAYGPKSSKPDVYAMMVRGFAAAARAAVLLGSGSRMRGGPGVSFHPSGLALSDEVRTGVFVCKCNESLGWSGEMQRYVEGLADEPDVAHAEVLASACVPDGVARIVRTVRDKGLTRVVLGSCVCCPLNFVCSACTDQRSRLKHGLFTATGISPSMVVTRNVRGEALSLLKRDPQEARRKLQGLLNRSIKAARKTKPFSSPARDYHFAAAVIGESEAAVHCASIMARMGMDVFALVRGKRPEGLSDEHPNLHVFEDARVSRIDGALGNFGIAAEIGELAQTIRAGVVVLADKPKKRLGPAGDKGILAADIACTMQEKGVPGVPFMQPGATSVAGLFLADPPGVKVSEKRRGEAAAILAASALPRGPRKIKGYTVVVDREVCRGCGRCVAACPYHAVALKESGNGGWYASVDEAFCKGCGNCISVCPSSAADSPYRSQAFFERTLEEILLQAG